MSDFPEAGAGKGGKRARGERYGETAKLATTALSGPALALEQKRS